MHQAWIGLIGVAIGSLVTLLASVIVPWIRDSLDRRRSERVQQQIELRDALLKALAALLAYRQARGATTTDEGPALARFGAARNELTVRLTPEEKPISDVVLVMLAMIQESRPRVANMIGEAMEVLTLWARGDVAIADVIPEVERRAGVNFPDDRISVVVVDL